MYQESTLPKAEVIASISRLFAEATNETKTLINLILERIFMLSGDLCFVRFLIDVSGTSDALVVYHSDARAKSIFQERSAKLPTGTIVKTWGQLLTEHTPLWLDASHFPPLPKDFSASLEALTDDLQMNNVLLLPMTARGRLLGYLGLGRLHNAPAHTKDEASFFQDIADRAAICLDNSFLIMAERIARQESERSIKERQRVEDQLRQSQKMDALGRLAGGISHDFNNLLSIILSYSEMAISMLPAGDPMRDDLAEIYNAGERAAVLTKQLLLFSHHQIIESKVIDVNATIAPMGRMLRRIIGEDIQFKEHFGADLHPVKMDPGHLTQILMNLVINARDAMPRGGKLTVETSNIDLDESYASEHLGVTPGSYMMIAVSDTGIGMSPEVQRHIFEPFFTTKGLGGGTGLGLATVFGIVQQNGGHIWIYSEPGQGSTFKIYLPRTGDIPITVTKTPSLTGLQGNETILLVEDEEKLRSLMRDILQKNGYRVLEAKNADEALLFAAQPGVLDLLLTDVVLPQMSGPQLAARLTALRPETKVLCASGYSGEAVIAHGFLSAGVAFLPKPITPDSLLRKVREVIGPKLLSEPTKV
jgi:signal transduction histidine kinase/CheY-like chemotaxis protein